MAAAASSCRPPASPDPLQGVVEFDQRVLAFDVGGRIATLRVVRGGSVDDGSIIATLDDSLDRAERIARDADLASARAQLALLRAGARVEDVRGAADQVRAFDTSERVLRRSLARQSQLAAAGAAPPASLDEIENQLSQLTGQRDAMAARLSLLRHGSRPEEIANAAGRVDAATAAINMIDVRLGHYTLHSPIRGAVLDVHLQPGEVCAPGTPIVTVGDVDHPYVDVFVPEGQIGRVRLRGPVHVRIDAVATPMPAVVEHIADTTEFTPRYLFSDRERPNLVVRVRVRVNDPAHRLRAGVPAFVTLDPLAP